MKTAEPRHCAICGKPFVSNYPRRVLCGDPECAAERQRRRDRNRKKKKYPIERKCSVCGKRFMATGPRHHLCHLEECHKKHHRDREREYGRIRRARARNGEDAALGRMWDPKDFSDPFPHLLAPLTGITGNHVQFCPMG